MLPQSDPSHKGRQAEAGVDNSKYCMEPGKPLLLFRAYKLTLKREEMYSSLNSGWEHSDGASHDTRYWEGGIERDGRGEAERRGKIKYSTGKQPGIWHMRCGGRGRMDLETEKTKIEYIPTHFTGLAHMFMDASGKCCRKHKIIEVKLFTADDATSAGFAPGPLFICMRRCAVLYLSTCKWLSPTRHWNLHIYDTALGRCTSKQIEWILALTH